MKGFLITTNYPPVGGGVSRYNLGLVENSSGRLELGGLGSGFPKGESAWAKLRQVNWSRGVARGLPREATIMASQPHLGVGCLLSGRPFTQFVHGGEWEGIPFGGALFKLFLRFPRKIVANSDATLARWVPPRVQGKSAVLKPGLSSHIAVRSLPPKTHANNVPGDDDAFRIVSVARLSPRKGFVRLIKAVVACQQGGAKVELCIVGSGPLMNELVKVSRGHEFISIVSNVPDAELTAMYDSADLFALLPHEISGGEAWEGFGIVYLEAAARGLPILATDSGGISEATTPEGAMLLAEDCGEEGVRDAILMLREAPRHLRKMAEANVGFAAENRWVHRSSVIDSLFLSGD